MRAQLVVAADLLQRAPFGPPGLDSYRTCFESQKRTLSENCTMRGAAEVAVITPNVLDATFVPGVPRSGRLNRLKASARKVSFPASPKGRRTLREKDASVFT
jgi:hypothetical protein